MTKRGGSDKYSGGKHLVQIPLYADILDQAKLCWRDFSRIFTRPSPCLYLQKSGWRISYQNIGAIRWKFVDNMLQKSDHFCQRKIFWVFSCWSFRKYLRWEAIAKRKENHGRKYLYEYLYIHFQRSKVFLGNICINICTFIFKYLKDF